MPNLIIVVLPDIGSEDTYVRIKKYVTTTVAIPVIFRSRVSAGDIKIGVATQCLKVGGRSLSNAYR